jgi:D-allulose-6-phosphate 3-epimerase
MKADFFHVDLMDGNYVKNISQPHVFMEQIRGITDILTNAYLVIENPLDFLEMINKAESALSAPRPKFTLSFPAIL